MSKKIIIVGTAYPYRGGLAVYNERLANEYIKLGYNVEIYTFNLQYPNFLFPGKTQYSNEPAPTNLTIFRKINSCNLFNWIKVGREIKRKQPEIMITKFWLPFMAPCLGTIERIVRKNKKTKVISILDNIIPHEKRFGDKLFAKYFVNSTDGFVAMSKSVLNDVELFDNHKPKLFCPHPLYDNFGERISRQTAIKKLGLDVNIHYVLFFGIIREYKGLDLLIDAFKEDRLKKLNVKLIVAGEFYDDSTPYYDQIKKNNLEDRIIMKSDFIPDSEVNKYFCASEIIAQPYKTATQSGVTQIAYHFEIPMLVTNVGGLPEIVPDGKVGYVVNKNSKDIATSLIDFFTNHRQGEFVQNIKVEKLKYSWKNMIEAISQLTQE